MSILKRKELRTMKTTAELFGENLRNQLIVKNKSQADIARYLKVTEASVSRWVNGLSVPRAKMIDKICLFLHCSVKGILASSYIPHRDEWQRSEEVVFFIACTYDGCKNYNNKKRAYQSR